MPIGVVSETLWPKNSQRLETNSRGYEQVVEWLDYPLTMLEIQSSGNTSGKIWMFVGSPPSSEWGPNGDAREIKAVKVRNWLSDLIKPMSQDKICNRNFPKLRTVYGNYLYPIIAQYRTEIVEQAAFVVLQPKGIMTPRHQEMGYRKFGPNMRIDQVVTNLLGATINMSATLQFNVFI